MRKKLLSIFSCCAAATLVAGCVGQGAYEKKTREASAYSREASLLKRENTEISRENEELRLELAAAGRKVSQLELSKKKLEETIASGTDRASLRLIDLERENVKLRADIDRVLHGREEDVRGASRLYENIIERLKDDIAHGYVKLAELRGRVTISVNGAVLFQEGKDVLKPQGAELLKKIAGIHKDLGVRDIQIATTFIANPASGKSAVVSEATWLLNSGRASAVAGILGECGFNPSDIVTTVSGRTEPLEAGIPDAMKEGSLPIEIVAIVND